MSTMRLEWGGARQSQGNPAWGSRICLKGEMWARKAASQQRGAAWRVVVRQRERNASNPRAFGATARLR